MSSKITWQFCVKTEEWESWYVAPGRGYAMRDARLISTVPGVHNVQVFRCQQECWRMKRAYQKGQRVPPGNFVLLPESIPGEELPTE